jgi:hypothetical protein
MRMYKEKYRINSRTNRNIYNISKCLNDKYSREFALTVSIYPSWTMFKFVYYILAFVLDNQIAPVTEMLMIQPSNNVTKLCLLIRTEKKS